MATITTPRDTRRATGERVLGTVVGPGGPWHATAPRRIRTQYQSLDDAKHWVAWSKHLAQRRLPCVGKLLRARRCPLLWQLPAELQGTSTVDLIQALARRATRGKKRRFDFEGEAERWLARIDSLATDMGLVLESLSWSAALPDLASQLPERLWWKLLNTQVSIADRCPKDLATAPAMPAQIFYGELALTLAYSFPELDTCRALVEPARRTIGSVVAELLDGEGLIHASHLGWLRPLVASWTRCHALGNHLNEAWCDEPTARQYPLCVRHGLRWSRADGTQPLAPEGSAGWDPDLVKRAIALAADRTTRQLGRLTTRGTTSKRPQRAGELPPPSFEGEWATTAVLRPNWRRSAPRLSVAYPGAKVEVELAVGKDCLWSGNWELEICRNGQPLAPTGRWEQVCWESDEEVDYLELEMRLDGQVTVQRHMLLARNDPFLILADAVLGSQPARIEYRGVLPLAGLSTFRTEEETREGTLEVGGRRRACVLPLALPEWRASPTRGSLQATEQGLELRQSADGRRLLAPLFIDFDARRTGREVTWRRLTVAEDRCIVPADMAVGYRVQAGKSQWLLYRSLGAPAIRSVLGTNLMHEFLVGEFQRDGSLHRLLEIEGA